MLVGNFLFQDQMTNFFLIYFQCCTYRFSILQTFCFDVATKCDVNFPIERPEARSLALPSCNSIYSFPSLSEGHLLEHFICTLNIISMAWHVRSVNCWSITQSARKVVGFHGG
jgi:hypothetical protein